MSKEITTQEQLAILTAFICHNEQKRKYTNEPYVNHCIAVADIVKSVCDDVEVICAAYLHDTIEDTNICRNLIVRGFGGRVLDLVLEVSDVSKPEDGNREARKQKDLEHLAKASPEGQTIKLADLIHNSQSITQYDKNFAKIYLKEKEKCLEVLTLGNKTLRERALVILREGLANLTNKESNE